MAQYTPKTWNTGETITATELNAIEQAAAAAAVKADLATVATSGSYTDLANKPSIPAAYTDEQAQDAVAAAFAAGTQTGVTVAYNDAANSLSITATGSTSPNATTTSPGIVQLAGDLGGTAIAPTVPGLANKVNSSTYTAGLAAKADVASLATVATSGSYADLLNKPTIPAAPTNATSSAPGLVQLAGDLAGTATAPTVGKIGGVPVVLSDARPVSPAVGTVRIGLAVGSDSTAPSTPTGLTVTPGNTQNALAWTASTDNVGVTGYKVRRGGTVVGTPSGTTYTDTGLTNGTTYSYTVSAVDAAANESAQTSAVTGTPTAGNTAPGQPTGLTAGTTTSSAVPLTWTAPSSNGGAAVTDYIVQYRTTAGPGTWTTFADGTSATASATVTGLTASTSYDFQVAAVNSVGTGAYSSTATASTAAASGGGTNPTSVTGLSARWNVDSLSSTDGTEIDSFQSSAGSATSTTMIAGGGSGPIYKAAIQNGLPVVRGDGSRFMFTGGSLSPVVGVTSTVFVVARITSPVAGGGLLEGDGANAYRLYTPSTTGMSFFSYSAGTPEYAVPNITSWHVYAVRRNGTGTNSISLWVDGVNVAAATDTNTSTSTQLRMFAGGGTSTSSGGDIGEIVAYNGTALSDTDMHGVAQWLGAKWGITVA